MIIEKMTASFGTLENASMELESGLNIVRSPNESGKSTWCSFIKAMLYGVDSSAREKGGVKPDKVKFAPWSGQPMEGTMDIEYEGRELTLTRSGRASAPMKDFSATLRGTADRVDIPSGAVGETLLGVSRDVFERSAFIGQGGVPTKGSPEIEKRIAAVVQTGDESSSVTQAQESLKAALRRRRFNKSGRLPEIEAELDALRAEASVTEKEKFRGGELRQAIGTAVAKRAELTEQAAESRRDCRKRALDGLNTSRERITALEAETAEKSRALTEAETELGNDIFGDEPTEQCRKKVEYDLKANADKTARAEKGGGTVLNVALLVLLAAAAILTIALKLLDGTPAVIVCSLLGVLAIVQAVRLAKLYMLRSAAKSETEKLLRAYGCGSLEEIAALPENHERLLLRRDGAQKALTESETKLRQANEERDEQNRVMLSELDFTDGDSEAVRCTRQLEGCERELARLREEYALWEGRQSGRSSEAELRQRFDQLSAEHDALTEEYQALTLALETVTEAGAEIQNRMTPELSRRAAVYFARLTGGKYDAVLLDKELSAAARAENDSVARESAFLSVGAVDQLYLAVRLAVCDLALPADKQTPVILDDALVNFDDQRCAYAIDLLRELAENRQILLFTCHDRESVYAKKYGDVHIVE